MELFAEQEREEEEKARLEDEKKQAKANKEVARETRRAELARLGEAVRFTKSLSSCKKDELEDVAFILGLKLDPKDTMKIILTKINNRFNAIPAMRADPHFCKIFESSRGSRRMVSDENTVLQAAVAGPSTLETPFHQHLTLGPTSLPLSIAHTPLDGSNNGRYHPYMYVDCANTTAAQLH